MKDLSIVEVKEFILWAKEQKVEALEIDGVKIQFSALAFIDSIPGIDGEAKNSTSDINAEAEEDSAKSPEKTTDSEANEDDEMLFWSANP